MVINDYLLLDYSRCVDSSFQGSAESKCVPCVWFDFEALFNLEEHAG